MTPGCSRRPNTRAVSLSCQVDIIYFFTLNRDKIFVLLDLSTFSGMQLNKPKGNLIFDICLPSPEAEVTVTNPSPWPCQCPTNQIPGLVPGHCLLLTTYLPSYTFHFPSPTLTASAQCSVVTRINPVSIYREVAQHRFRTLFSFRPFYVSTRCFVAEKCSPNETFIPEIYRDVSTRMIRNVRDWILHTRRPARNNQT